MDQPDPSAIAAQIAAMTDDEVRRAYLNSDPDDAESYVEALVAALQARNIDI